MITAITLDIVILALILAVYILYRKVKDLQEIITLLDKEQHEQNMEMMKTQKALLQLGEEVDPLFTAVEFLLQPHADKINNSDNNIFKTTKGEA